MFGEESSFSKISDNGNWFSDESEDGSCERYSGFDLGLSIKGPRATKSAGSNAKVSSPFFTCIILSSLTLPITEH